MTDDNAQDPQRPQPPNYNTVSEKSREAQNHGSSTSANSQHNYQTANATEPNQLAEQSAENRERFKKKSGNENAGSGVDRDDQGDFRQHDAGG